MTKLYPSTTGSVFVSAVLIIAAVSDANALHYTVKWAVCCWLAVAEWLALSGISVSAT